jgi:hypothetical protein
LGHVTVQRACIKASVNKFLGELAGLTLGATEDYGLAAAFGLQDSSNHFVFI